MPTPPPADVIEPHDTSPEEVESRAELDLHLARGSLAGLTVQGLRLDVEPVPDLSEVDLTDTLFVGCRFPSREIEVEIIQRGAHVVPPFAELPYPTAPSHLYTPDDLVAGFDTGGFAAMYDTQVYEHFRAHGGALPAVREALAQRMHDHGIDNALADATHAWLAAHGPASVVGVMGGHAVPRGTAAYRLAATLGWELTRAGRLVITGGGPGVMEAANLGSYLSGHSTAELTAAIDLLATAPDFNDHERYTAAALQVRAHYQPTAFQYVAPAATGAGDAHPATVEPDDRPRPSGDGSLLPGQRTPGQQMPGQRMPGQWTGSDRAPAGAGHRPDGDPLSWARRGGLAIPTWLYGHEPANLFAGRIAKYFSNAIREDTILRLARGGIVFAAGRAGTVQEVFQAATKTFYGTDGASGAYVFLDKAFWTHTLPIEALLRPLLALSPFGDLSPTIHLTDDVHEAVRLLTATE